MMGGASDEGASSRRRRHVLRWAVAAGVLALLCLPGCASRGRPAKACLVFSASDNLNLYDGQPHALTVYLYPLASGQGFEQANVDDLLGGATPPGVLAPPSPITIAPGEEKRSFEDLFPSQTTQIGVVADYYRAPGDPEGTRTQVVPARCGMRKPKLVLSAKDVYRK
jgi:type VI secretion system VasD/TssJ family lipoprotein